MPSLAEDAFSADLASLKEMGLNAHDLHALTIAGPDEAGVIARQLAEGEPSAVRQINGIGKQVRAAARELSARERPHA